MAEPLPGPWQLKKSDPTTIEADSGEPDSPFVVAKTYTSPFAPTREIAVANAQLIAASSDLLAVAQQWLDWWNSPRDIGMAGPTCDVLVATEAAIAKAKGKTDG